MNFLKKRRAKKKVSIVDGAIVRVTFELEGYLGLWGLGNLKITSQGS